MSRACTKRQVLLHASVASCGIVGIVLPTDGVRNCCQLSNLTVKRASNLKSSLVTLAMFCTNHASSK